MESSYFENNELNDSTEQIPRMEEGAAVPNGSTQQKGVILLQKIKQLSIKVRIAVIAALVILIAIPVGVSITKKANNNYETPLKLMMRFMNGKEKSFVNASVKNLNGFSELELTNIFAFMKKSDDFQELLEELQESYSEDIEDMEDEYGKNYKCSYVIEDKEKLEKDDLKAFKEEIKSAAKSLKNMIERTEEYDSDDWEDIADRTGFTKAEAKAFIKLYEALYEQWHSVDVTEGYELEVTMIIDGSELDEPEEDETTIFVYKVNGRWICDEMLSPAMSLISQLSY